MISNNSGWDRYRIMVSVLFITALILLSGLFYIQVIDSNYLVLARNNTLRNQVQFPPRGEVYDRNGEFLVQSRDSYDLMVVPRDVEPFDTLALSELLDVPLVRLKKEFNKASRYSKRKPSVLFKQLPKEVKLMLDEKRLKGFYTVYRTVRTYPRQIAGNLLGYVGEVNQRQIDNDNYYNSGDYVGMSGIEQAYETELRGQKGVAVEMVDAFGLPQGSYANGAYDTLAIPGKAIVSTLDASLQEFAEELMQGKIGSCVAIEPATGEILVMANTPSYNPDLLIGRQRGNNYAKMANDNTRPLFNRAVKSRYPPGSTFKVVNGLIGLQEGLNAYTDKYPCHGKYPFGRGVKCHPHWTPIDMIGATQTSCNAYFCYVTRGIYSNPKYENIQESFDKWREYVLSFGFGRKLDSDFLGENTGFVPKSSYYDKIYNGSWNPLTVISLSIGQGELGTTPLQMANLAAIMANKGYYYIPHVVKKIDGQDSIDKKFYQKQFTMVEQKHFEPIVEGMYRAVNEPGGTSRGAKLPGIDVCGKTGTAENSYADHSVFICFAPRENPKIAMAVYIEHGRFGASTAVPIASLLLEKYLTGKVKNQWQIDLVKNKKIAYPMYEKKQNKNN